MGFIVKLAVGVLEGYREWTESLGVDREWVIQAKQSEIHMALSVEAARLDTFALPFRGDIVVVLGPPMEEYVVRRLAALLSEKAPVPPRVRVGCGSTPAEALDNAFYGRECVAGDRAAALVAHVDIDNITGFQRSRGVYRAWDRVLNALYTLHYSLQEYGAIVSYLGGDNVLALLPGDSEALLVLEDTVEALGAKAGVGLGSTGRRAASLATMCLDRIRAEGRGRRVRYCRDPLLDASRLGLGAVEWENGGKL